MARLRAAHGFTLVEVLVVLAIIALTVSVAVPRAQMAVQRGREARVVHALQAIRDALERHHLDRGYYPIKLGDLLSLGYLRQGTSFRSPVNLTYYYYAVDDNRDDPDTKRAQAFVLGHSAAGATDGPALHRGGPLPGGRNPGWRARAWRYWRGDTAAHITLFSADDVAVLPDPLTPDSLATYRFSCTPESLTACDLHAN